LHIKEERIEDGAASRARKKERDTAVKQSDGRSAQKVRQTRGKRKE
jgi:hypothetical protein